jgi:transposase
LLKNPPGKSSVFAFVGGNVGECIAMMGQRPEAQDKLFYSFSLNDHVPPGHLLRGIDQVLDLRDLRAQLTSFYSDAVRPSIDPELILRMLIVGYCFGIRSERRQCEEVHLNFAYRWFCRLELDEPVPNHSTFSKNRHGRFRENLRQSRFQAAKATASCPRYPPECGRQNAVAIDPRSSVVPPPESGGMPG